MPHAPSRRAALLGAGALAAALPRPARAQARDKVAVGVLRFVSSGGLFLAVERGHFRDAGIDVDLKFFEAAQPIALAVVSGDADYGVTAFTAGMFNLAGKGALKVIAAQAREARGYEGNLVLASQAAADKGLAKLEDLPGRSLGITQVGSSFHYQAGQIARVKGFELKSVALKPLQSLPNVLAALRGGQVDAAILAPHLAKPVVASGEARLLARYSDLDEYQFGGLFAAPRTVAKRELTTRFVRAYRRGAADYAEALLRRDPSGQRVFDAASDEAASQIAKHVYPGQELSTAVPLVRASAFYVDREARLDPADLERQVAWGKEQGLVDAGAEVKAFLDQGTA